MKLDPQRDIYRKNQDKLLSSYLKNAEGIILPENRALLNDMYDWQLSLGLSKLRALRVVYDLGHIAKQIKTPLAQFTDDDVQKWVMWINELDRSDATKVSHRLALKRLFQFIKGYRDLQEYPPEVAWIRLKSKRRTKVGNKDLLSEEQALKMLECANTTRDKCFISLLFETGMRIGEILCMQRKHIEQKAHGWYVYVPEQGKTGARECIIKHSAPLVIKHLQEHPIKDPEAPLWLSIRAGKHQNWSYWASRKALKEIAKKADIKKRMFAHLLRHSAATILAPKVSDTVLKRYFGWSMGSTMPAIYIHMAKSSKEIDNEIISARTGKPIPKKDQAESALTPITCWNCKTENGQSTEYCMVCGMPLTNDARTKRVKEEALGVKLLSLLSKTKEGRTLINEASDEELEGMVVIDGIKVKRDVNPA
jgi:integrase/recombinase XerD